MFVFLFGHTGFDNQLSATFTLKNKVTSIFFLSNVIFLKELMADAGLNGVLLSGQPLSIRGLLYHEEVIDFRISGQEIRGKTFAPASTGGTLMCIDWERP